MSLPTTEHRWAPRLRAWLETGPGTGLFELDPHLEVIHADWSLVTLTSTALVRVAIDTDMPLMTALKRYHKDVRLCIALDESVVFDGYPAQREYRRTASSYRGNNKQHRLDITLAHSLQQMARCPKSFISGRYMLRSNGHVGADVSATSVSNAEYFDGLICIFNENGTPNRAAHLLTVNPDSESALRVPIFGNGSDSSNTPWTIGDALSYLIYFHMPNTSRFDPLGLIRQIQAASNQLCDDRDLRITLRRELHQEVIDARFLNDVLREWCQRFEIHLIQHARIQNAMLCNTWAICGDRATPIGRLPHRDGPRNEFGAQLTKTSVARLGDRIAAAGANDVRIQWDETFIKPVTILEGARRRFEFRAELMPGWLPEVGLDNLEASQRTSAKSITLTDDEIDTGGISLQNEQWYQQYHRAGQSFDAHRDVARKWVLNESGAYANETFARNAPFTTYTPFEFSGIAPGRWARRSRQLLPTFDATATDRTGVRVELSFDGGSHWYALRDHYDLLEGECGIWFNAANPLNITVPDVGNVNLWYALVDQTMRVRITASVEADERLAVRITSDGTLHPNAGIAHRRDEVRYQSWQGTHGTTFRDDAATLRRDGRAMSAQAGQRGLRAELHYPWLETTLIPGARIHGLLGPTGTFETDRPAPGIDPFIERIRFANTSEGYGTRIFLTSRNS